MLFHCHRHKQTFFTRDTILLNCCICAESDLHPVYLAREFVAA